MTTAAIVSGGLDSVTLAYLLVPEHHSDLMLVSFNYGQRHRKELGFARLAAERLGVEHVTVDLTGITSLISSSSLTSDQPVPEGHYAEDTMRATVVPNRNLIMLSIAAGIAVSATTPDHPGTVVATGVHAGDHFVYPDCRPEFIHAAAAALFLANVGFANVELDAPFSFKSKADIVALGSELGVPFADTWSCYQGGDTHCGVCGTCTERREAFELAGVTDPTVYADLTRHW